MCPGPRIVTLKDGMRLRLVGHYDRAGLSKVPRPKPMEGRIPMSIGEPSISAQANRHDGVTAWANLAIEAASAVTCGLNDAIVAPGFERQAESATFGHRPSSLIKLA